MASTPSAPVRDTNQLPITQSFIATNDDPVASFDALEDFDLRAAATEPHGSLRRGAARAVSRATNTLWLPSDSAAVRHGGSPVPAGIQATR